MTQTSDWQPIETAPKDGTEILVSRLYQTGKRKRIPEICYWHETIEEDKYDKKYWCVGGDYYGIKWLAPNPTHWMPLPEPPKELEN